MNVFPIVVLIFLTFSAPITAQNHFARIEGTVVDMDGAVISGAAVTARNVGTGDIRTMTTNDEGVFRFPILTAGSFTISTEANGFKRFERRGIDLSAGDTATVNVRLEVGSPNETVTITSDAAIADQSKIAVGRQLDHRDIVNLPLVSRNPYNFILLQPGVNGREVSNPKVIDMSAAGLRRRVGYQIDGSNDNDFNQSGYRLNLISETAIREVQLLTTSYPAEYGGTAGAIVNSITRSGTNELDGSVGMLYRPSGLTAKPFGFQPGTGTNIGAYGVTAAVGGPIVKDRWHFFAAYEWTRRNNIVPINISQSDRASLIASGVSPAIFVNKESTSDTLPYLYLRTDVTIPHSTRLSLGCINFVTDKKYAGPGGPLTTDRSFGLSGPAYALTTQAVTSFSSKFYSEFRFQAGRNITRTIGNDLTGRGPTVNISGVAGFGPDPAVGSISPDEGTTQFQEALTRIVGSHIFKFGGGVNFIADRPTGQLSSQYTFSDVAHYVAAAIGHDPKAYRQYQETAGDNKIPDNAIYYNAFFQDDWALSRRARLSLGLRYEYFDPPSGDPSAPLAISRAFNSDKNNFAPRVGFTYLVYDGQHRTVIRVGGGVHYDPPQMAMYRRALLNNGNPRYVTFSLTPGDIGAPNFPDRVGSTQPPNNIDTVAPDFRSMYAVRSSIQVEQAISNNMSITLGYVNSIARHIPVYRNMNCRPTGHTLADGRPVYGTNEINQVTGNVTVHPCVNKIYPQFNIIKIAESSGNQSYNGLFLQIMKRFSNGFQLDANYTLSRSVDDAPEENGPGALTVSDPSNRRVDRGSSRGDLTRVFNLSLVARPKIEVANRILRRLLNENQLSAILIADSGEPFNITTGDINGDGVTGATGPDRPVGVLRNAGRLPAFLGVDARYSRYFGLSEKRSIEFYIEATNFFNSKHVDTYNKANLSSNNVLSSIVNPITGELRGPLPPPSTMSPSWRESRQVQIGVKVHF